MCDVEIPFHVDMGQAFSILETGGWFAALRLINFSACTMRLRKRHLRQFGGWELLLSQ